MKNKELKKEIDNFLMQLKEAVETIQQDCDQQEAILQKLKEDHDKTKQILQIHEAQLKNLDFKLQEVFKHV